MGEAPGWYGKLASLGDFAHRRLPPEWLKTCDPWLSQVMKGAADRLGAHWLDVYLTAPPLRFAWAPGVLGPSWWFGVLMPSCDSVGRYFPLLVAQARTQPPQDAAGLDWLERWYEAVVQAALHTLDDLSGVDDFELRLSQLPAWPGALPPSEPAAAGALRRYELPGVPPLSQWVQALGWQQSMESLAGCTLWWQAPQVDVPGVLSIARGLPDAGGFVRLLEAASSV